MTTARLLLLPHPRPQAYVWRSNQQMVQLTTPHRVYGGGPEMDREVQRIKSVGASRAVRPAARPQAPGVRGSTGGTGVTQRPAARVHVARACRWVGVRRARVQRAGRLARLWRLGVQGERARAALVAPP